METIHFTVACSISFLHRESCVTRRFAARSLHSFQVEDVRDRSVTLVAPGGEIAYGVWPYTFERLPAGYVWVKFKGLHILSTAKKDSRNLWVWQGLSLKFEADRFYALKILPGSVSQTDSCNFMTKDGEMIPYVNRNFFSVVSEIRNSALPRVLEAFPLPIPGVQREHDPGVWDVPMDYDCVPITHENHVFSQFKHPTVQPVAALRLGFDTDKKPLYWCSYFGPALK